MSLQSQDVLAVLRYEAASNGTCWHGPRHLARALGDPSSAGYADAVGALQELQSAGKIKRIRTAWPPAAIRECALAMRPKDRTPADLATALWQVL